MNRSNFTTYIIKITNACNLQCVYCYSHFLSNNKKIISYQLLDKLFKEIAKTNQKRIQIIWHGGEPLLAGIEFFDKVLKLQRQNKSENQIFINNIQSNATLLTKNYIKYLLIHEFGLGISLDGPEFIHNAQRPNVHGESTFNKTIKSIEMLREFNYLISICSVITPLSAKYYKEIYDFFLGLGIAEFDPIPCMPYSSMNNINDDYVISPEAYGKFLCELFDIWIEGDIENFSVRFFTNILQRYLSGYSSLCKISGTCSSFLAITNDGDVYPCDSFIGNSDFNLGNIEDKSINQILKSKTYENYLTSIQAVDSECKACRWFNICKGGCSYQRYMKNTSLMDKDYYCYSNQIIFQHIEKYLNSMSIPIYI